MKWFRSRLRSFQDRFRTKPVRTSIKLLILIVMPLVLLVHVGLIINYIFRDRRNMPDINILVKFEPPIVSAIYDEQDEPIINLANEFRWLVKSEEIPEIIKQAVLSAEDKSFYGHNGISFRDIARASHKNGGHIVDGWLSGKGVDITPSQGASTLDQQLARSIYLKNETNQEDSDKLVYDNYFTRLVFFFIRDIPNINRAWRKVEEARLALWINEEFSKPEYFGSHRKAKEEIMARYLSEVYFRYVYGIKAAAKFYFDKDLIEFNFNDADKAAFLAGVIKNPSLYAPRLNQKKDISSIISLRQINRRNAILDQMVENGYLTQEQAVKFKEKEIIIPTKDIRNLTDAPTVVTETLKEVRQNNIIMSKVYNGDLQTYTTVNREIQKISQEACENGLTEYEKRHPQYGSEAQCAILVLRNKNAAILAEVGGRKFYQNKEYLPGELNRVNRARQVGSAFKPFVYLTAFMVGHDPYIIRKFLDSPISLPMGSGQYHPIHNYDGKFLGDMSLCEALYRSRNAPTVRLSMALGYGYFENSGMKKIIDTARLLGVKSPFHNDVDHLGRTVYYPTSALGASEMTVVELANAYREMASGISAEPYIIQRVIDRHGKVLFEKKEDRQISEISPEALDMIRSCLRKVVTQPGGTAYSLTLENFPVPIAGKTGTTDDFRNALFAGWTHGSEGITVVARIDFDDNRPLNSEHDNIKETGARTTLPIVKEIFRKVYEQNLIGPAPQFPEYIEPETPDIQQ